MTIEYDKLVNRELQRKGYSLRNSGIENTVVKIEEILKNTKKHCAVMAPVKSGKKIIIESLATRDDSGTKHIFLTALNRIDCKSQRQEIKESCGDDGVYLSTEFDKLLSYIDSNKMKTFVIHLDESDYGTGEKQRMSKLIEKLNTEGRALRLIGYSATNEELVYSKFGKEKCEYIKYIPPANYRGAEYFLDNNLVIDATKFFDLKEKKLTEQGKHCLNLINNDKHFGILREVYDFKRLVDNYHFRQELEIRNIKLLPISKENSFDFGETGDWKKFIEDHRIGKINPDKYLFLLNQKCVRSTEIGFHNRLAFLHDYRKKSNYNTEAQAYLRVAHFKKADMPENKIMLFCKKEIINLAAHRIKIEDLETNLSSRIEEKAAKTNNLIKIKIYHCDNSAAKKLIAAEITSSVNKGLINVGNFSQNKVKSPASYLGNRISNHGTNDWAAHILKTFKYISADEAWMKRRGTQELDIFIDGPNIQYPDSWNKLIAAFPQLIGKTLYIPPNEVAEVNIIEISKEIVGTIKSIF